MSLNMQGLLGKKLGMTQVFDDKGHRVAVTLIQAGPCVVVQRKTQANDGYDAVQLGFGDCKEKRTTKASMGRFKKVATMPKRHLAEFVLDQGDEIKEGDIVNGAILKEISHVDVTAITKGRGFQGVVKRHGMRGGPFGHGGHSKRRIGSVGQNAFPARVSKGHRMPGHMGNVRVTQQNLRVVGLEPEKNLLMVEGAVPGATGGIVFVRKALKKKVAKVG
jgi:large subunit ribosomal protein L3